MSGTVQPIPSDAQHVTPHLVVSDAAAAIDFYVKAFGAKTLWCNTMGDSDVVLNACMMIGDSPFMLNDEFPDHGCLGPQGPSPVTIHLYVEDVDAVYEQAVAAGATAVMPPQDMFWGDRYGRLLDPFGHSWSIATHVRNPSPEELEAGAKAAFSQ